MNINFSELLKNNYQNITYKNNSLYIEGDLKLTVVFDIDVDTLNVVVKDGNIELIEINPNYKKINIEIKENAVVKHSKILLNNSNINSCETTCNNYGKYDLFVIDLFTGSDDLKTTINLLGEGSQSHYRSSIVTNNGTKKKHVVEVKNMARYSVGDILNYGVVYGDAILDITGIGDIQKGAKMSVAKQKTNIVTFDEKSKGYARPFLYIAEDDVQASHDTAVGMIDENIIFYMCSRGVRIEDAKRFIALGYFKPIIKELDDVQVESDIIGYLEGVIK